TVAGCAWTVPVELEALLPPAVLSAGALPVGAAAVASPAGEVATTDGLAFTAPTWTVPTELVAVLPASASALPAVPSAAAHAPTARPNAKRFMIPLFLRARLCRRDPPGGRKNPLGRGQPGRSSSSLRRSCRGARRRTRSGPPRPGRASPSAAARASRRRAE